MEVRENRLIISLWSDPSMYLNLMFLINYLLKKKFIIILICKKIENINDFNFFIKKNPNLSVIQTNLDGKFGYIKFFYLKYIYYKKLNPRILISVNFISLFFSYFLVLKKTRWIYYNFDFDLKVKLNNFIEKIFIKKTDHILIPSESRLKVYKRNFDRVNRIYSINNCFSKEFKIKKLKKYNKFSKQKYLIRLGSFSNFHALKEIAISTKYWKKNILLIMAGKSYDGYFEELKRFVKFNNLKKVILLKDINYYVWFALLERAIAGFALYDPINTSHNYMGGTSQKLNNYIYYNIPSLISKNRDFYKFNKKYQTSISVKNNPKDIAQKVNKILKDKNLYSFLKKKNREAFIKEFNFEKQIKKIKKLFA